LTQLDKMDFATLTEEELKICSRPKIKLTPRGTVAPYILWHWSNEKSSVNPSFFFLFRYKVQHSPASITGHCHFILSEGQSFYTAWAVPSNWL
jgi:hypothetical protein